MEILKKIIIPNNKQPLFLQTDSRNDSSLHQNCKTNFQNNNKIKINYTNLHNYNKIKTVKTIKIPLNKIKISLENKNTKKENIINTDYQKSSYTDKINQNKEKIKLITELI